MFRLLVGPSVEIWLMVSRIKVFAGFGSKCVVFNGIVWGHPGFRFQDFGVVGLGA